MGHYFSESSGYDTGCSCGDCRRQTALDRGAAWLAKNRTHVEQLVDYHRVGNTPAVKPTGSDLGRPELWKDIHWLWYFEQRPEAPT